MMPLPEERSLLNGHKQLYTHLKKYWEDKSTTLDDRPFEFPFDGPTFRNKVSAKQIPICFQEAEHKTICFDSKVVEQWLDDRFIGDNS